MFVPRKSFAIGRPGSGGDPEATSEAYACRASASRPALVLWNAGDEKPTRLATPLSGDALAYELKKATTPPKER